LNREETKMSSTGKLAAVLVVGLGVLAILPAPAAAATVAPAGNLQLTVTPKTSAADTPLTLRVSGLRPGARVALSVTSVDAAGFAWHSFSTYAASSAGIVDPATASLTGSVSQRTGTPAGYVGTDPMGPVDFMTSAAPTT
jgi:hypothetical protein